MIRSRLCELCRRPLPPRIKKRGRPPVWHEECRQFHSALTLLQARAVEVTLTQGAARQIKADLFDLANTLPIVGRDNGKLGRQVRAWRLEKGLLQREVATELGCTRSRLGKLEAGQGAWSFGEREKMLDLLSEKV